ncbi:hypothetical protein ACLOJK_017498 [Asimina triloba]
MARPNITTYLLLFILQFGHLITIIEAQIYPKEQESDRVLNLPGQPSSPSISQFSGYIDVDQEHGTALFYWFFEAQSKPSRKPLLWLNGGPGCSSILGETVELGPLRVKSNGTGLEFNKHAWNKGHYVPQLAELVFDRNKERDIYSFINLKGFMVGDPVTNDYHDMKGMVDFAWSLTVISDEMYEHLNRVCDFKLSRWSNDCNEAMGEVYRLYQEIDIYNIHVPTCVASSSGSSAVARLDASAYTVIAQPIFAQCKFYSCVGRQHTD